ncbi:MAG TPA: DUF116 domain-containing protein [Thermodesulfovibrionales bacterium]|nr:DUF116 domain-containing protein [Thermodesulfovibrionales bacterium]
MGARLTRGIALKVLYPILMFAGSFFKEKREDYQRFIINLNNSLVKKEGPKPEKVLLLLPHCLQINQCDIRLTYNIQNCKRCGKCGIRDLIKVAEDNRLSIFIATGGSLARRVIGEIQPDAVVAVACENDLSSGIADIYPLPVLGVPNERPEGPCINTRVDIAKIKAAIMFLGAGYE